jgi:DNA polymerase III sliding clamp (beta) subunit (PCNA family)
MHVASFSNVLHEQDKLHDLYDSLVEARKEVGQEAVPFHKFAEIVKGQVKKLRDDGNAEVAFRVAVKDGKVAFTARALKGAK